MIFFDGNCPKDFLLYLLLPLGAHGAHFFARYRQVS